MFRYYLNLLHALLIYKQLFAYGSHTKQNIKTYKLKIHWEGWLLFSSPLLGEKNLNLHIWKKKWSLFSDSSGAEQSAGSAVWSSPSPHFSHYFGMKIIWGNWDWKKCYNKHKKIGIANVNSDILHILRSFHNSHFYLQDSFHNCHFEWWSQTHPLHCWEEILSAKLYSQ